MYTYIPSLWKLSPLPCTPLGHHRAQRWAPCATEQLLISYLFYTQWCVCILILPSQFISPSPSPCCVHFVPSLHLHLCSSLQVGSSEPFFLDSIYIYVNIQYMFFSFWLTSLYMTDSRSIRITTDDPNFLLCLSNIKMGTLTIIVTISQSCWKLKWLTHLKLNEYQVFILIILLLLSLLLFILFLYSFKC